ncbi:MAG: MBL fold metallo-hydrolase [Eubacteriales bacterium]|nr:MBL fold metallo-hydrolase [Eubacteriales bacterium]
MTTKMTVIVDNIPSKELEGEWGLSILIEYKGKKILADVGASELFAENLKGLGFDIEEVDYATLSHAHYDHSNGMPRFFEENTKAKFYVQKSTKANCYAVKKGVHTYIGIPENVLEDYADRIELVSGDYQLTEGVYLIPHKTEELSKIGEKEKMYLLVEKEWIPDDFSHEQSLVLETEKGLVIINCCSHGGAVNIINEIRQTFPEKKVYGLIGGFHLYNKSDEEVYSLARRIKETGIEYVCTGHCTEEHAYGILKEELGDRLEQLRVGLVMEF